MGATAPVVPPYRPGVVLVGFSAYSLYYASRGDFIFLPVMLGGIAIGYYPDGWFASTLIGGVVILMSTHALLLVLSRVIPLLSVKPLLAPTPPQ